MRDRRFVAVHRGGPLDRDSHGLLARWAADCAESVLPFFGQCSDDLRPEQAIAIARSWAKAEVPTGAAMRASLGAHAAAREVTSKAAIAVARAAGHAAATAHFADHCMGALLYALRALNASGRPTEPELESRLEMLPSHLQKQVLEGIAARLNGLGIRSNLSKNHRTANGLPPTAT